MHTHEISYFLKHETLGRLPGSFRTTEEDLDFQIKVLLEATERGEVCGVVVKRIAAQ